MINNIMIQTKLISHFKNKLLIFLQLNKHASSLSTHAEAGTSMPKPTSHSSSHHKYKSVIGLEVHAQITSESKLFSSAGTSFFSTPNSQVDLFDLALPGSLPVLNERCVEAAILTSLAFNCQINMKSQFDRKHYFYADMPAGFQITQQRHPIASNGYIEFIVSNPFQKDDVGYLKRSEIKQIQLEQDSGKSLQDEANNRSLIDLNRAGVGLMELVFEPDLSTPVEAVCLVKELTLILKRIGTCSCKMNEAALRVDANISVHKPGEPFGVRTEVKNLNSFRFMQNAIQFEIDRQIALKEEGKSVINETRMFDFKLRETIPMRDKEVVQDYRFMPEPNLPPLYLCDQETDEQQSAGLINISIMRKKLPSLTSQDRKRLIQNYHLNLDDVFVLMNEEGMMRMFEQIVNISKFKEESRQIYLFMHINLRETLESFKLDFVSCSIPTASLTQLIDMFIDKQISVSSVRKLLSHLLKGEDERSIADIVDDFGCRMIKDDDILRQLCINSIVENKKLAKVYMRKRKRKPRSVLVGHVLKASERRFNEEDIWIMFDKLIFEQKILDVEENKNEE